MNPENILKALKQFTDRERIEFLPLAPDSTSLSEYAPIHKYALDLKNGAKPESAAEDLFTALWKDILGVQPTRQVGVTEGFVDFMVPERLGDPLPLELKPLFQRDGPDALWRKDANPKHHVVQVKKYLRDHEYLILTDLRTTWFFCARDFFFEEKSFATLPFDDFLNRCRETRSVLDTLRRIEDTAERPELEQQFFEDLKIWYNEFDKVKWVKDADTAESIILLINKLIFARTIEDFGLVPYRFTQDEYIRQTQRWEVERKRAGFAGQILRLEMFDQVGVDFLAQGERFVQRGVQHRIGNVAGAEFGQFLQFGLMVFRQPPRLFLQFHVHERVSAVEVQFEVGQDSDHVGLQIAVVVIGRRELDGLFPDVGLGDFNRARVFVHAEDVAQENLGDEDAAGVEIVLASEREGGLDVGRHFGQKHFAILGLEDFLNPRHRGVNALVLPPEGAQDFDEEAARAAGGVGHADFGKLCHELVRAFEIAFLAAHRGADFIHDAPGEQVDEGIGHRPGNTCGRVVNAFVLAVGREEHFVALAKDVLVNAAVIVVDDAAAESLIPGIDAQNEVQFLAKALEVGRVFVEAIPDAGGENFRVVVFIEEVFKLVEELGHDAVRAFGFWPCWFHADGTPKPPGSSRRESAQTGSQSGLTSAATSETPAGFDGVIGNPPWEGFKPVRKEFAASFYRGKTQFSKMGMDGPAFEKWFADELKENQEFVARWHEHEAYYERHKEYFGRAFHKQGTGDWNLFKLFIERDLSLVRQGGQFSLLVPSSIQTDEGCSDLRRWFITENRLDELTSFENRGYTVIENGKEKTKQIFPDVDSRFKFGFFKVVKGAGTPKEHAFDARFYLHDPKDYSSLPIRYAVEMIRRFSPHNESFMEFRSPADYALATKIRGDHRLLEEFGYTFRRELHMTGDNRFFRKLGDKKPGKGQLRLYEGKMIHQFDAHFSPPTNVVDEAEIREELLRKEIFRLAQFVRDEKLEKLNGKPLPESRDELDKLLREVFETRGFKLQYEFDRFAYREVARSTDERTIIGTVVPKGAVMAHTLMYLAPYEYRLDGKKKLVQQELGDDESGSLIALANSLVLNFYIRSKVSAHVSAFQFLELPAPKLAAAQKQKLAVHAATLLENPRDVKERAALEVFIARELYGLSLEDWKHLTGTFTFGGGATKAELDEIIRQSLVLWGQ